MSFRPIEEDMMTTFSPAFYALRTSQSINEALVENNQTKLTITERSGTNKNKSLVSGNTTLPISPTPSQKVVNDPL
jgi:hypothetical protein